MRNFWHWFGEAQTALGMLRHTANGFYFLQTVNANGKNHTKTDAEADGKKRKKLNFNKWSMKMHDAVHISLKFQSNVTLFCWNSFVQFFPTVHCRKGIIEDLSYKVKRDIYYKNLKKLFALKYLQNVRIYCIALKPYSNCPGCCSFFLHFWKFNW